ncbi:outer membrane lipoprotein-sorting protein [Oceanispirochaeta sp.]|jgi:hypothetical protein|uniref:outer membrane lipoprotein-sorting protein n=1 Tax=Oceanispirochaeta sp. TaxID=2035350 RepID=UPI002619C5FE|nr:outer membrane lipoprotein-sorting protein [Oceanispirochaeta sp.]MDA3958676.1 outer membrane lipoprotein-sorting protein [Oceanispirochaeta sp.]
MRKIICLFVITVLTAITLQAQSVQEILDSFSKSLAIPTIQGSFQVQLIATSGDTREIQARVYQQTVDEFQNNRLFIFDFPPTVRGTGLLINAYFDGRDNNMWIYLPAVRRIKRIALDNSGGGYFMGSDFTYNDLISNAYNKLEFERLEDQVIEGNDCYVVKAWGANPRDRQEHGYGYTISYHRKDNYLMIRRDFYDLSDHLLKIYTTGNFLDLYPYIYPTEITMENVQTGHKSILSVTDVSTDEIPDRYFTPRFLQNN